MGGIISLFGLAIYFNLIGVLAAALSANILFDMDALHLTSLIFDEIILMDISIFILKILISGAIIFSVSSLKGLKVKNSSHEVPQATMSAVISSLLYVVVFHLMFTLLFYALKLGLI